MLFIFILQSMAQNISMLKGSLTEHGYGLVVLFYCQSCYRVICKEYFLTLVHELLLLSQCKLKLKAIVLTLVGGTQILATS